MLRSCFGLAWRSSAKAGPSTFGIEARTLSCIETSM